MACRLRPGERLKIQELCSRLGVSPGAVREALSRLSAEELVVAETQKGFRVAPVWADDLEDLRRTRVQIETMCLERAIAAGGLDWEAHLVAAAHKLFRTPLLPASDEWSAANADFHLALVSACDSPWLLRIRALLYAQAERYRRLSLWTAQSEHRDVEAEHRAIMDAALSRDAARACKLLTDHLSLTASMVLSLAAEGTHKTGGAGSNEDHNDRSLSGNGVPEPGDPLRLDRQLTRQIRHAKKVPSRRISTRSPRRP